MSTIKVALIGQPNVGKSALINAIGNTRLKVGNFSGVTVSKKRVSFSRDGIDFEITDLPGSYSLTEYTIEEKVTKDYLDHEDYDLILNVVDSCNLERNLYLTTELLSLHKKMVVALNMSDEADSAGISIDEKQLSKMLGIPCIKTSAIKKTGIDDLLDSLIYEAKHALQTENHLQFSAPFEEEIARILAFLQNKHFIHESPLKALAIKLLREDKATYQILHEQPIWTELQPLLNQSYQHLYLHHDIQDLDDIFNDEKNALCKGLATEVAQPTVKQNLTVTDKLDSRGRCKSLKVSVFIDK